MPDPTQHMGSPRLSRRSLLRRLGVATGVGVGAGAAVIGVAYEGSELPSSLRKAGSGPTANVGPVGDGLAADPTDASAASFASAASVAKGSHVVDVTSHGATGDGDTDDTAAIQAVLDAASGKSVVRFPRATYAITSLQVPSHTVIDLGGSTLLQTNNTNGSYLGAAIRNADFTNGNTDITIANGTISGGPKASGRLLQMLEADNVTLTNLVVTKGKGSFVDWMFVIQQCDNVVVSGCRITGGTAVGEDGLHIKASSRICVSDCHIDAGDDAIAIVQEGKVPRPITDVSVSNCVISSRSAHLIRVSVYPEEVHGISRVTLSNITGSAPSGAGGTPILVNDETGRQMLTHLTLDNVVLDCRNAPGEGLNIKNAHDCTFSNVQLVNVQTKGIYVTASSRLTFDGCTVLQRSGVNDDAVVVNASSDLILQACRVIGANNHAYLLNGGSADIALTNCTSTDPKADNYHLGDVKGVRLLACTGTGGVQGVACEGGSAPSGLTIIGCAFSGQADKPLKNAPDNTSYVGNVDGTSYPSVGNRFAGQKPTVSGSVAGNPALASLVAALSSLGLVADSTTD